MRALGLAPGDRVGVIALNSDRYLELYLGLPAAGYRAIGLETMCIGQGMAMLAERLS